MRKIKFALLGYGFIGQKHAYFIDLEEFAELTAIIDDKADAATYPSVEDFIKSDGNKTDVVCVSTPNGLHYRHAKILLEAGYHVIVEKPMALKARSAMELKRISEQTGKKLFVVMQNRYSPASKWVHDLVNSNALGEIFLVQVNCFWNRDERYYKQGRWHGSKELDGGTIYTQFSHFVDMLYWCFGEVKDIKAELFDFNHKNITEIEDSGFVRFSFVKGGEVQFNFSTSCHGRNLESSITVLAEKGSIKLGGQYMDTLLHCDVEGLENPVIESYSESFGPYKGNAANHRFVIRNVVECLNGVADQDTPLEDGIKVVEIIENMYNSVID